MVQTAIGNKENLSVTDLAVNDTCQIYPSLADEISSKFYAEMCIGKDLRQRLKRLFQSSSDRVDIDWLVTRKIGNAKTATQINMRRRHTDGER